MDSIFFALKAKKLSPEQLLSLKKPHAIGYN